MKKLLILIGSAALLAGCQSAPDYGSGKPGNMGGSQVGTINGNGYSPASAAMARSSASGAIGYRAGVSGTRLGTGP